MATGTTTRPRSGARNGSNGNGNNSSQGDGAGGKPDLIDREPPVDLQAEQCLLGSLVLMPEACDEVAPLVRDTDFYDEAHQVFYRHICALHETNRRFDIVLLTDRIKTAGEYEKVGGAKYVAEIVNKVPNAAHATHYAEIVRDKSLLRRLIGATTEVLRESYDGRTPGPELVAQAEAEIARISDSTIVGRETETLGNLVVQSLDSLEERMRLGSSRILNVGLDAFRDCMGLVAGGVTIVAGRASMGKTACSMTIAYNVARSGGRVLIVSLEMSAMELADRLLCMRSLVPFYKMASGRVTTEERMRLVEASATIGRLPIVVDDRPGQTVAQIGAAIRREQRRGGLALAIIDYAQLIEPHNSRDERTEQLAKISRSIKLVARQAQIPVISLVQVNRQSENNADLRPRLHQLKGSGSWEEDADSVAFVFRPHFNAETGQVTVDVPEGTGEPAEIIMAKNRNGPRQSYEQLWFKDSMTWANKAEDRYTRDERNFHEPRSGEEQF